MADNVKNVASNAANGTETNDLTTKNRRFSRRKLDNADVVEMQAPLKSGITIDFSQASSIDAITVNLGKGEPFDVYAVRVGAYSIPLTSIADKLEKIGTVAETLDSVKKLETLKLQKYIKGYQDGETWHSAEYSWV